MPVYLHPKCSPTQQCARVFCVPGTLCKGVEPMSCDYTIRPGKARLLSMYTLWAFTPISINTESSRWPPGHSCGRRLQRQERLFAQGGPYKMYNRSTRDIVSSSAAFPFQSETHVQSLQNMCCNLKYGFSATMKQTRKGPSLVHGSLMKCGLPCRRRIAFFRFTKCINTKLQLRHRNSGVSSICRLYRHIFEIVPSG